MAIFDPHIFDTVTFDTPKKSLGGVIDYSVEVYGGKRRKKRKHRDREEEVRQERIRLGILPPDQIIVKEVQKAPEPHKPEPLSEVDAEIAALMAVALQSEDIANEIKELLQVEAKKRLKRNRAISLLLLAA